MSIDPWNTVSCLQCYAHFTDTPENRAVCPACTEQHGEHRTHMERIRAGDMKVQPDNDYERDLQRDARLRQLDPKTKDCLRPKQKGETLKLST